MNARLKAEGKHKKRYQNIFFQFFEYYFSWVFANPEKLGAHCMKLARELYQKIACEKAMIKEGILAHLIQTLMPFWRKEVKK